MIDKKLKTEIYARAAGGAVLAADAPKAPPRTIEVSKRAIVIAVAIVLVLVIAAIVLTQVLPKGAYERALDADGNEYIVEDSYREDDTLPSLKWWQAVFSPVLVLDPGWTAHSWCGRSSRCCSS